MYLADHCCPGQYKFPKMYQSPRKKSSNNARTLRCPQTALHNYHSMMRTNISAILPGWWNDDNIALPIRLMHLASISGVPRLPLHLFFRIHRIRWNERTASQQKKPSLTAHKKYRICVCLQVHVLHIKPPAMTPLDVFMNDLLLQQSPNHRQVSSVVIRGMASQLTVVLSAKDENSNAPVDHPSDDDTVSVSTSSSSATGDSGSLSCEIIQDNARSLPASITCSCTSPRSSNRRRRATSSNKMGKKQKPSSSNGSSRINSSMARCRWTGQQKSYQQQQDELLKKLLQEEAFESEAGLLCRPRHQRVYREP